jgi:hypothetical protein
MIVLQSGLEIVASWAISNSDPANLLLLGVVYYRLSKNHSDLADKVDKMQACLNDMNGQSDGDS